MDEQTGEVGTNYGMELILYGKGTEPLCMQPLPSFKLQIYLHHVNLEVPRMCPKETFDYCMIGTFADKCFSNGQGGKCVIT